MTTKAVPKELRARTRARMAEAVIQAMAELVLSQKNADVPNWLDVDLTVSQLRAVYLLAYHGTLSIGELAGLLKLGYPATSVLVQQLVRQQLAERSEDTRDRRRSWVSLTERGAQLVGDRREQREAQFLPRLNRLSDERLRGLQRGLEALITAMREEQQK
jgi:DNA-binding MarR family transcriptional regulator